MATLPTSLRSISQFLERLPGIGEKTANRLAFYLLRMPEKDLQDIAEKIRTLKSKTKLCKICLNLTEDEICEICKDDKRDHNVITVVEDVLDLLSFETGNIYEGVYHVLHGRIDPLNNVGPDDIYIQPLINRVRENIELKEAILATNPDMEGEATAMYIRNKLNEIKKSRSKDEELQVEEGVSEQKQYSFKISRLAYGLPMGGNLEYADYMTLRKSIEGRSDY
jgi:recombination protein RecR